MTQPKEEGVGLTGNYRYEGYPKNVIFDRKLSFKDNVKTVYANIVMLNKQTKLSLRNKVRHYGACLRTIIT